MTSAPPDPVVSLESYTVAYGKFTAVDAASFAMPRGACGLLGQNGAGKSSILKAILGLVKPRGGRAHVLGFDAATQARELRDAVGYMPEKEAYMPGLSGLDSVMLAGRLSGLPAAVAKQRAHEVLWLVGLDEARYRNVASYSLGMKQKVKLAMALVHDPQLLFLDEPTNGLDPEGRTEILELMRDLIEKKGKSIILSSHILSDVESLCEHAVLIDGGRVIAEGAMSELTRRQGRAYDVRFVGAPAALRSALEERGIELAGIEAVADEVGAAPGPGVVADPVPPVALTDDQHQEHALRVVLRDGQGSVDVFSALHDSSCALRALEATKRALSDVFLESVQAPTAEGAS